jgi:hypothetical protein
VIGSFREEWSCCLPLLLGFFLFFEISLLTSPVEEIMAIVLAFLTYAIGFFSLMIHFFEEQTVSARAGVETWRRVKE